MRNPLPDPELLPFALTRFAVQHLPPRRRGMRLAGAVQRRYPPSSKLLDARLWCGCHVTVDLRDAVQASMYYRGVHEPATTAILRQELKPRDCFVDVGANAGYYSFTAACLVGSTGVVHAVEPSPKLIGRLARDIERNGMRGRIFLHPTAVSDFEGIAYLQRGSHDPTPDGDRYISSEPRGDDSEEIPVTTLDRLLTASPQVDVMKIDVEGNEAAVLRGSTALIERCRPRLILVEVDSVLLERASASAEEVHALLLEVNYEASPYECRFDAPMVAFRPLGSAELKRPVHLHLQKLRRNRHRDHRSEGEMTPVGSRPCLAEK